MTQTSEERMRAIRAQLQKVPTLGDQIPGQEGAMVRDAIGGQSVYEIAQTYRVSETAVWGVLTNALRNVTGAAVQQVETGGLGSDTDPGVTGGYGETGFGSIGNEGPIPVTEEPPARAGGTDEDK